MNNLKYGIKEPLKSWYEWLIYPLQMILAVFVATVLIAKICGTSPATALIGAAVGTIIYELITGFNSPMFISSCGATVSAVTGALAVTDGNYTALAIGGLIIFIVYGLFALIIKMGGKKYFDIIFPPTVVGAVTIVIGLNLAKLIPSYLVPNGTVDISAAMINDPVPMLIALFTMVITAVTSHYGKGFWKTISFLIGLLSGFGLTLILELTGVYTHFNIINTITTFEPFRFSNFAFMQWKAFDWSTLPDVVLLFLPVSICAVLEHYSDHKVLSNIIGEDLTQTPGLHRTLLGDGLASAVGVTLCGLPNTSYGESIATIGFSRVTSVWVTFIAAIILGLMAFIPPVVSFINSIPSAVFAGCAFILYGYIAASGLKTLINNKVDLEDNRNLIVVSIILTIGISGVVLFTESFAAVSLAMVLGVITNLLFNIKPLRYKKLH